jgi:hypothetical protein
MFKISGEYSQDIPVNKPWEKVPSPPVLPPHLLQVILNKDTPLSVSEFLIFFWIETFLLPLIDNNKNCALV